MNVIEVQKVPVSQKKESSDDILAQFCYYYPQYKFHEAKKLPIKRVVQMLRIANRELAKHYSNLLEISVAPHTQKAQGVKKLRDVYGKGSGV